MPNLCTFAVRAYRIDDLLTLAGVRPTAQARFAGEPEQPSENSATLVAAGWQLYFVKLLDCEFIRLPASLPRKGDKVMDIHNVWRMRAAEFRQLADDMDDRLKTEINELNRVTIAQAQQSLLDRATMWEHMADNVRLP